LSFFYGRIHLYICAGSLLGDVICRIGFCIEWCYF